MSEVQQIEPKPYALGGLRNALENHDREALRPIAQGYLDLESICGWAGKMAPHLQQIGEAPLAEAIQHVITIADKIVERAVIRIPVEAPEEDDLRPIWEQIPPNEFVLRLWQDLVRYQEIFVQAKGQVPESWEPVLQWAAHGLLLSHGYLATAMDGSKLEFEN